jgi:hypothetical protein
MNKRVSFLIAKLLKEKEFNENCRFGYNGFFEPHHIGLIEFGYLQQNSELLKFTYTAPTIADVVMWLHEKHGIWINVSPTIIEYNYRKDSIGFIYHITKLETYLNYGKMYGSEDVGIFQNSYYYNSPTEAYQSSIEYALNKLI